MNANYVRGVCINCDREIVLDTTVSPADWTDDTPEQAGTDCAAGTRHEPASLAQFKISNDEARDAYYAVAEEMPELTLDDLDEAMFEAAKQHADDSGAAWPPLPRTTGWQVNVLRA